MRRRLRAGLFFALAAIAGLAGAGITSGYREGALAEFGALRPVVVVARPLTSDQVLTPRVVQRRLKVVRVPARFVPRGTAASADQLLGLKTRGDLPVGTYLGAPLLQPPDSNPSPGQRLSGGRRPVEIVVAGAAALAAAGSVERVDIIVTTEPVTGAPRPRSYVAATAVPLLDLSPARREGDQATAVLGLRRRQALRLIRAESYARGIRLVPSFSG